MVWCGVCVCVCVCVCACVGVLALVGVCKSDRLDNVKKNLSRMNSLTADGCSKVAGHTHCTSSGQQLVIVGLVLRG